MPIAINFNLPFNPNVKIRSAINFNLPFPEQLEVYEDTGIKELLNLFFLYGLFF